MHTRRTWQAISMSLAVILSSAALAAAPQAIHYQGYLTDADGNPLDETVEMEFRLYDVEVAGEAFWSTPEVVGVDVEHGVFRVNLAPVTAEQLAGGEVWLGITVIPADPGEPAQEMEPRLKVLSVPYALVAEHAATADVAGEAAAVTDIDFSTFATGDDVQGVLGLCIQEVNLTEALSGYCAAPCYGDAEVELFVTENGYVTFEALSQWAEQNISVGLDEDALAAYLSANGYMTEADLLWFLGEAGFLKTEDLAGLGYVPGPHYTDGDVEAVLATKDFCEGPCFSGSYDDLAGKPSLDGHDADTVDGFDTNATGQPLAQTIPVTDENGKIPQGLLPFSKGDLLAPADRQLVEGLDEYETGYFSIAELGIEGGLAANVKEGVKFGPAGGMVGSLSSSVVVGSPYTAEVPVVDQLCNSHPESNPTATFRAPHDMIFAYWNSYNGGLAQKVNVVDIKYDGETSLAGQGYWQGLNKEKGVYYCYATTPAKAGQQVTYFSDPLSMPTCSSFLYQLFGANAGRLTEGHGVNAEVRKQQGGGPWSPADFATMASAGPVESIFDATDGSLTGPSSITSDAGSQNRLVIKLAVPPGDWDSLLISPVFGGSSSDWCPASMSIWDFEDQSWVAFGSVALRSGGWRVGVFLLSPDKAKAHLEQGIAYLSVATACSNGTVSLYDLILLKGHYYPQPPPYENDSCYAPKALDLSPGFVSLQATTAQTGGPNKGIDDFSDSSCGNHPGPDLAYSVVLNERSILDVTVVSAFDSVTYVRSSDCEDGAEVACGTDVLATEPLEPGTYYLFIDSTALDQAGPFTLIVQKTPAPLPQNDSCATAQSLGVVGESVIVAGTSLYAVDQYQGTCGGVGGEDVVYSFATAQVKDLHVTLEGAFDSVLYLRANSCADGFTVSCSADGSLDVGGLSPGAYFLFVDGAQPDQAGDFQLTVALN